MFPTIQNQPLRSWVPLTCLLLLLSACSDPEITRMRYLEMARAHFEAENYDKARVDYLNALRIEPNDPEARHGAGYAFEKLGAYQQAMGHYAAATDIDPNHLPSRISIAKLLILARAVDEARPYVEQAMAIAPDNLDALALKASLVGLEGNFDEAHQISERVVAQQPDHRYAVPLLASRLVSTGQLDEARAVIERAVALAPDFVGFRGVYTQVLWEQRDIEGYLAELQNIAMLEPEEVSHHVNYARALTRQGRKDEALAAFRARVNAADAVTRDRQAYLGFLAAALPEEFEAEADALRQKYPEEPELALLYAEYLERSGEHERANALFAQLREADSERIVVAATLASVRESLRTGETMAARNLVEQVRKDHPNEAPMLRLSSEIAVVEGDLDRAIGDIRVALRDDPANLGMRTRLVGLYQENRQLALAQQVLEETLELPEAENDRSLQLQVGQLSLSQGNVDRALEMAGRLVGSNTDDRSAHELRYRAALAAGDLTQAVDSARELERLQPDTGIGPFFEGLALQARGDKAGSIAAFERSLSVKPGASEPLSALLRVYLGEEQHERALATLAEQQQRAPGNPLLTKFRGDVLADRGDKAGAVTAYREVLSTHPALPVTYQALSRLFIANSRVAEGIDVLVRGVATTGHRPLYAELALAQQSSGDIDAALTTYRNALGAFPADQGFANNLAMLIAEYRPEPEQLNEALNLVNAFETDDNPAFLDTLGWVRVKRGEYPAAVRVLERAVRLAPDAGLVRYHLGRALLGQGNEELALAQLQAAVADGTVFSGAEDARALVTQLSGQFSSTDS